MARSVWDDVRRSAAEVMTDAPSDNLTTPKRTGSDPTGEAWRPQKGRPLPWLIAALSVMGLAALALQGQDERQGARAQLARSRDEAAEMRRALFQTQARLEGTQKTAATLATESQANEKLLKELRAVLDAKEGDVSSSQETDKIAVNLVDQILFKSGDAGLSARGKQVLSNVGGVLKGLTDKQIVIGGHTDDRPIRTAPFPSNWELSAARAVNVARYLAETVGVAPKRLAAAGYSQFHPRSEKDKAKNRRIEILLTPIVEVTTR